MARQVLSFGVLVADHLCAPIDHLPEAGELVLSTELPLAIGGCAANAAIDLAKCGVAVGVVGCVGADPFGRFVRETLASQGVDAGGIRTVDTAGTSGTLIINVQGQDRRFIHTMGANAALRAGDVSSSDLAGVRVLYVGGYLLMPGVVPGELAALFRRARALGIQTALDVVLPSHHDPDGRYRAALAPVLAETDVFLPNHDEGRVITGQADPLAQAQAFRDAGAATVVITCGGEGTVLVNDSQRLRAGVYRVPFVGGTGAGDAFDAGYIVGMLEDLSPQECLRWGSALGASCVQAIGATEGVLDRRQAEAFLREHPLECVEL